MKSTDFFLPNLTYVVLRFAYQLFFIVVVDSLTEQLNSPKTYSREPLFEVSLQYKPVVFTFARVCLFV